MSYHIVYHIISYIMSYHIIYHNISYIISYIITYHIISYHIISYHIISYVAFPVTEDKMAVWVICTSTFVNNQFDAQFFYMYVYFYSLYVSDSHVSIIRRINCINTTSGIMYLCVDDRLVYQTVVYTEGHIPDVVLIQLILLMMDTWLSETYRE